MHCEFLRIGTVYPYRYQPTSTRSGPQASPERTRRRPCPSSYSSRTDSHHCSGHMDGKFLKAILMVVSFPPLRKQTRKEKKNSIGKSINRMKIDHNINNMFCLLNVYMALLRCISTPELKYTTQYFLVSLRSYAITTRIWF